MIPVVHELITTCVSLPFAAQQVVYSQWRCSFFCFFVEWRVSIQLCMLEPKMLLWEWCQKSCGPEHQNIELYHHKNGCCWQPSGRNTLSKHGTLSSEYDSISLLSRGPMSEPSNCLKCWAICGNVLSTVDVDPMLRFPDLELSCLATYSNKHRGACFNQHIVTLNIMLIITVLGHYLCIHLHPFSSQMLNRFGCGWGLTGCLTFTLAGLKIVFKLVFLILKLPELLTFLIDSGNVVSISHFDIPQSYTTKTALRKTDTGGFYYVKGKGLEKKIFTITFDF